MRCLLATLLLALPLTALAQGTAASVYVQDQTTQANGGSGKAQRVGDQLQQALSDAHPCVETSDQQDVKDALGDLRDQSLQEDTDPNARLREIGQMVGADILIGIQALPGPNGSTQYSAFAMDSRTARTVARAMGSESQVIDSLVQQLASSFTNACRPHWVGTVHYSGTISENKSIEDGGPMLTMRRSVRRSKTEGITTQATMSAQLLPEASGGTRVLNSPMARVVHIVNTVSHTQQTIQGEQYCRVHGRNPYWEGFSESSSETTTLKGRATGTSPVFILIDSDGRYTIKVTVPGGESAGTWAMEKSPSQACGSGAQPDRDLKSLPPTPFDASGFDAEGRVDPAHKDSLSGSYTAPDGKSRMNWNLRLVKPRAN